MINVDEIIMCKDCKYYDNWLDEKICARGNYYQGPMEPDDFCSKGEPKNE